MFGLGIQELILLGLLAGAVAVIVVVVVTVVSRASAASAARGSNGTADRIAALEEEHRRLRAELDELRRKGGGPA